MTAEVLLSVALQKQSIKLFPHSLVELSFIFFGVPKKSFMISPNVRFARRHDKKNVIPVFDDEKKAPHTAIENESPGETPTYEILRASSKEIFPASKSNLAFFTPTGKPPVKAKIMHTAPSPSSPKKSFDGTATAFFITGGSPKRNNVLLITMIGKTDGIIILEQRESESEMPFLMLSEKTNDIA